MKDYYEPAEDSYLLLEQVRKLAHGRVLDMGTGSGILAIGASEKASRVTAADINPAALNAAKKQASARKIANIRFRKSDLFQNSGADSTQ
jgi:release factor glutamine methyltransferase